MHHINIIMNIDKILTFARYPESSVVQQVVILISTFAAMKKLKKFIPIKLNNKVIYITWESNGTVKRWKIYRNIVLSYLFTYLGLNVILFAIKYFKVHSYAVTHLRDLFTSNSIKGGEVPEYTAWQKFCKEFMHIFLDTIIIFIVFYHFYAKFTRNKPINGKSPDSFYDKGFSSVEKLTPSIEGTIFENTNKYPWRSPDHIDWYDRGFISWRDVWDVTKRSFNNFKGE